MVGRFTRRTWIGVGSLAVFSALFAAVPAAQAATLTNPQRAEWGCELSNKSVVQGITAALIGRGWALTQNDSKGNLVAQILVRGKHTLVIDIAYDKKSYDVTYKSSINLNYKDNGDGTAVIHGNANKWLANIHGDIARQLAAICSAE